MGKKPTRQPASSRQAKIQAAQTSQGSGANKIVVATVVLVVAIIAVVGGVIWMQQSQEDEITGGGNALPTGVSELGQGFPAFQDVTAAANAPTVDVYVDYQCPACASFEAVVGDTFTSLAQEGKIKLVYHVKNFLDDNLGNDSSTRAGNAAFCASDDGRFEAFHEQVFPNQPAVEGEGFTDAQLQSMAEAAGVTGPALTTWQACVDAGKYVDYVDSVEATSFQDGVRGTPTVRINGEDVELGSIASPELLTEAIENATQ
ncbi:mycothiol-dependent reductase [Fodinibacter luteus]|uniref:Mycothiol-dependent reductase n=1 Tax=Fodinibacter luteus TaxID=552064 RepID=A0ABP8K8Z4_9MICO